MTIGLKLKLARVEHRLSQAEAAKALGVSQNAITKWENDQMDMSITNAQKICLLYGKSMDEIFMPNKSS